MKSLLQLREALENSWCKSTTYCIENFNRRNPSDGQCLVSSLVIQDYFGGTLYYGIVKLPNNNVTGHYWLKINGVVVDFTWQQFPRGSYIIRSRKSGRISLLKIPHVNRRYTFLADKVKKYKRL